MLDRLMESHDLRTLYSTTLTGLHSRTYQLKTLMSQISPSLLDHLSNLGLEMAYLSQWFMTLFATSCPLNILFRIYDVVFAEGADETIMRVALALILSNEHKLMAMKELEEILQLLLGRRLWDPYISEPDFLMDEIARLSNVVTPEELDRLHEQFAKQGDSQDTTVRALGFTSGLNGLKIFAQHFRTPSSAKHTRSTSSSTLLETPAHKGHGSRKSISRRSVANAESLWPTAVSNEAPALRRTDTMVATSEREHELNKQKRADDRALHEQVEGLLDALKEVQQEAAQTAEALLVETRRKESMAEIVVKLRGLINQREEVAKDSGRDRRKTLPPRIDVDNAQTTLGHLRRRSGQLNFVAQTAYLNNLSSTSPDIELQESLTTLCTLLETNESPTIRTPHSELGSPFEANENFGAPHQFQPVKGASATRRSASIKQHPAITNPFRHDSSDSMMSMHSEQSSSLDTEHDPFGPSTPVVRPRTSSLRASDDMLQLNTPSPAPTSEEHERLLAELVKAKTGEAMAIQERDETHAQLDRFRRAQEASLAREAEWSKKTQDMERLIAAQQLALRTQEETHARELARVRQAGGMVRKVRPAPLDVEAERQGSVVGGSASLWPSSSAASSAEPVTPTKLLAPLSAAGDSAVGGAWSWFSLKGRSASTSSAA